MTVYEMLEISEHCSQEELDSAYQKEMQLLERFPAASPDETAMIARKKRMLQQAYEQKDCLRREEPDIRKNVKRPWYMPNPNALYGFHIPFVFYGLFKCCDGCCGCDRLDNHGCVEAYYDGYVDTYDMWGVQHTMTVEPICPCFRFADTVLAIGAVVGIIVSFFHSASYRKIRVRIKVAQAQRDAKRKAREYAAYLQEVAVLNEQFKAVLPYKEDVAPLLKLIVSLPGNETTAEYEQKLKEAQTNVFDLKNQEIRAFCRSRERLKANPYYQQLRLEHPEYDPLFTTFQSSFSDVIQW